jgi:hypothetical protein
MRPGAGWRPQSGPLAAVQHNGNKGEDQAGPTTNGVQCIKSWVGEEKWDVITMNFGMCVIFIGNLRLFWIHFYGLMGNA